MVHWSSPLPHPCAIAQRLEVVYISKSCDGKRSTKRRPRAYDIATARQACLGEVYPGAHTTRHRCNDKVEACDDDAEEGYTDSYVPEALPTLQESYDAQLVEGIDTTYIGSDESVDCTLYLAGKLFSISGLFRRIWSFLFAVLNERRCGCWPYLWCGGNGGIGYRL